MSALAPVGCYRCVETVIAQLFGLVKWHAVIPPLITVVRGDGWLCTAVQTGGTSCMQLHLNHK